MTVSSIFVRSYGFEAIRLINYKQYKAMLMLQKKMQLTIYEEHLLFLCFNN